ncbi:MAG: TIGR00730 family Rossman fold protein [Pseudomonadota bacterium]
MAASQLSVLVFCGARPGNDPAFLAAAREMGTRIAANGWRLVYGAGDVGLMGAVAEAAIAAGGNTLGIIPQHLVPRERRTVDLGQVIVTETMHERKKVMFMNADMVAVLPGGAGSLDEVFEVLTWRQIGLHEKPIYLINTEGYWDKLIGLVAHVIDHGFADPSLRDGLIAVQDSAAFEAHAQMTLARSGQARRDKC